MSRISDKIFFEEMVIRFKNDKSFFKEFLFDEILEINEKLKNAEKLKSNFISNIRNEIINPFTSIIGLANSIKSISQKNKYEKIEFMSNLIYKEAFSLDFHLKNIFISASLEKGDVNLEIKNFDIINLIKDNIKNFKHRIKEKDLKISIKNNKEKELIFSSDYEKIKIIFSNLLSNAIKFSNENEVIEISIEKKDEKLKLSVKDFGIGIEKEEQNLIFNRFKRLNENINSQNRGYGLGLAIVSDLLTLMSGEIYFKSKINEGSTFTFIIPEKKIKNLDFVFDDGLEFF